MEFLTYAERVGQRRGFREGKIVGKLEGKLDGIIEGKIKGLQRGLIKLLELRFDNVPERMQAAIESLADPVALDELFILAFKCQNLKAFEPRLLKEYAAANRPS